MKEITFDKYTTQDFYEFCKHNEYVETVDDFILKSFCCLLPSVKFCTTFELANFMQLFVVNMRDYKAARKFNADYIEFSYNIFESFSMSSFVSTLDKFFQEMEEY